VIDLHTHTTASDGRCGPVELVARARAAGVRVLSVTDHDTVAGCDEAAAACPGAGIDFVPGIEVTAVQEGLDVHVLGYFIDTTSETLLTSLAVQRQHRIDRFRAMVARLAEHGLTIDADAVLQPALDNPFRSVGRPWLARALVEAGHVRDIAEAFDRWLATGRPAFVPRAGAVPEDVFAWIHEAGGIASLAHPGLLRRDDWIPRFAGAGLDAIEAYHSKHDAAVTARYLALARDHGLAVSGGSDYHADEKHGAAPGSVALPPGAYEALQACMAARRAAAFTSAAGPGV
jgi:predicted metal-dependent phosphoesterase TrpH